jgi:hypothetical protein
LKVSGVAGSFEAASCPSLGIGEGVFGRAEDSVGHIDGLLDGFGQDVEGYSVL